MSQAGNRDDAPRGRDGITRKQLIERGAVLGGAAAIAPALAGCGSSDGTDDESTGDKAVGKPVRGGSLTMGLSGGGTKEYIDGNSAGDSYINDARGVIVFAGLTWFDNEGKVANALAEEFTAKSPDVWQVRLREGLEFHNGKTVTADDVIYSIGRIKELGYDGAQLEAVDMKGIRKLDARTIEMKLSKPNAILDANFASYNQGMIPEGSGDKGVGKGEPIGAGPFTVESFTPGQQSVHKRFANYFDSPKPYLDELTILSLPDTTARVNALISGKVDMIDAIPAAQVSQVEQAGKAIYNTPNAASFTLFAMNCSKAPFNDVRVRQAFRLLADREQMVAQALGPKFGRVANDVYSPQDPSYIGDELPQHEYDPEKAKSLLKQAGVDKLTVDLNVIDVGGGNIQGAQVFAQNVKKAGVGVTVNVKQLTYDAFLQVWPNFVFNGDVWGAKPYLVQVSQTGLPNAPSNETHFDDPEWLSLYQKAIATVDEGERERLVADMQRIDHDRGGNLIWAFFSNAGGYDKKVGGMENDVGYLPLNLFARGGSTVWIKS